MAELAIINGYDIRDRRLADATTKTTVATTDYVMVQNAEGAYTKILKSNFTEAVRDVLGGLLNGNDKGTTIDKVACLGTSTHDFGSITTANLASVLGAAMGVRVFPEPHMGTRTFKLKGYAGLLIVLDNWGGDCAMYNLRVGENRLGHYVEQFFLTTKTPTLQNLTVSYNETDVSFSVDRDDVWFIVFDWWT